jgi:hypothetical protein
MRRLLKHLSPRDLWLVLSACTTGAALVFALVAPVGWTAKVLVLATGLALAVGYHIMWWRMKEKTAKEIVVLKETVVIDANGSAEITFAPPTAIVNPKLVLRAHGRPVVVEDVWHAGISVVSAQREVTYWHKGVVYGGHIDANQPLKVLLRNEGFAPAAVQASIVVTKQE